MVLDPYGWDLRYGDTSKPYISGTWWTCCECLVRFSCCINNSLLDNIVEIGLHVLEHQVDILIIFCPKYIVQLDDVGVFDIVQKGDLSEGSLGIGRVLESIEYFFQSYHSFCFLIDSFPNVSICSRSYLSYKFVSQQYVLLNLLGHILNIFKYSNNFFPFW